MTRKVLNFEEYIRIEANQNQSKSKSTYYAQRFNDRKPIDVYLASTTTCVGDLENPEEASKWINGKEREEKKSSARKSVRNTIRKIPRGVILVNVSNRKTRRQTNAKPQSSLPQSKKLSSHEEMDGTPAMHAYWDHICRFEQCITRVRKLWCQCMNCYGPKLLGLFCKISIQKLAAVCLMLALRQAIILKLYQYSCLCSLANGSSKHCSHNSVRGVFDTLAFEVPQNFVQPACSRWRLTLAGVIHLVAYCSSHCRVSFKARLWTVVGEDKLCPNFDFVCFYFFELVLGV